MPMPGQHRHATRVDPYNKVYKNVYVGNGEVAKDLKLLRDLKITHVLNAAHGKKFAQIDTDADMYEPFKMKFLGIPALDIATYKIDQHFQEANAFIKDGIDSGGSIYVHCHQGRSRSATLVLAYMMLSDGLSVQDAVKSLLEKRKVTPNDGFIRRLCELQIQLQNGEDDAKSENTSTETDDVTVQDDVQ